MNRSVVTVDLVASEMTWSETTEVGDWVSTDTESGSRWGSRLSRKQGDSELGGVVGPTP